MIIKQIDKPLYGDLIWSQPQRTALEPQVLIIGGHAQALQAPMLAFEYLKVLKLKVSIVLPDLLKKILKPPKDNDCHFIFCPSTPSGSLSFKSLELLQKNITKHSCLFVVGDLSANQETQQLLLSLINKFDGQKIIVGSIVKTILKQSSLTVFKNLNLILDQSQLKLFIKNANPNFDYNTQISAENLAKSLQPLDLNFNLITSQMPFIVTKHQKQVCLTKVNDFLNKAEDFLKLGAFVTYYLTNYPQKTWPSLVCGAWQFNEA